MTIWTKILFVHGIVNFPLYIRGVVVPCHWLNAFQSMAMTAASYGKLTFHLYTPEFHFVGLLFVTSLRNCLRNSIVWSASSSVGDSSPLSFHWKSDLIEAVSNRFEKLLITHTVILSHLFLLFVRQIGMQDTLANCWCRFVNLRSTSHLSDFLPKRDFFCTHLTKKAILYFDLSTKHYI